MEQKLYTRGGDDGRTGLFGGQRVEKDSPRVAAYGEVDELNAALGLAAAACRHEQIGAVLRRLQGELFELGANLSTPPGAGSEHIPPMTQGHVERAERAIDAACEPLEPMRHFILPGGGELAARLHVARAVCRRAERAIVTLGRAEGVDPLWIRYVNRVGDLLFALARRANQLEGVRDVPWKPRG